MTLKYVQSVFWRIKCAKQWMFFLKDIICFIRLTVSNTTCMPHKPLHNYVLVNTTKNWKNGRQKK